MTKITFTTWSVKKLHHCEKLKNGKQEMGKDTEGEKIKRGFGFILDKDRRKCFEILKTISLSGKIERKVIQYGHRWYMYPYQKILKRDC